MDSSIKISDLIPDPKNARVHPNKNKFAIKKSLENFGAARSLVIDRDNVVRAGNGTLEAAIASGISSVRVIEASGDELIAVKRSDWDPIQASAYAIADNRAGELAKWDSSILKETLEDISESLPTASLGFDPKDLEKITQQSGIDSDFEIPPIDFEQSQFFEKVTVIVEQSLKKEVQKKLNEVAEQYETGLVRVVS